jgi:hypothetical protein
VSQPYSTSTNKPSLLCLWGHIDEKMRKPRGQGYPGTFGSGPNGLGEAPTVVKTFGKASGFRKIRSSAMASSLLWRGHNSQCIKTKGPTECLYDRRQQLLL